jgi:hypothetical protein
MAKKRKAKQSRKQGKKQRRALGGNALIGTFAGGVVGKVVERLIVNEIEGFIRPHLGKRGRNGTARDGADDDAAGRLLTVLADGGCKDIPHLLTETRLGLSKLLHALQTLRDFRLINVAGEAGEETIEVTRRGAHAATALRKNQIHDEAARLLAP